MATQPYTLKFMTNTVDELEGRYEIIVSVADAEHAPVTGVSLVIGTDYGIILTDGETTDEHGRSRFTVQTSTDHKISQFTISCTGVNAFAQVRLPMPTRKHGWTHGPAPFYIAGVSIIVAILCVIWLGMLSVRGVAYLLEHPLAEQAAQDMKFERNDVEKSAYQYLDLKSDSAQRVEDSLENLQADASPSGASFGYTVLGFVFAVILAGIFLSIAAGALVRDATDAVLLMAMVKRTGIIHGGPKLKDRIVDKVLGPPAAAVQPAQVQEMIQPQLAARQGVLNNFLQMVLFSISAYFVKTIVKKALLKQPLTS